MDFTTDFQKLNDMHTALLIDLFCWQQKIIGKLAEQEAAKHDCGFDDVMEAWAVDVGKIRTRLTDEMYEKYGPDLSDEVGLSDNEEKNDYED